MAENQKYREQTTRLIEENRNLIRSLDCIAGGDGIACGGCVSCLLRRVENDLIVMQKDYTAEQKVNGYRYSIIDACTRVINALEKWPMLKWRSKAKLIADYRKTVRALDAEIDHVREEQRKGKADIQKVKTILKSKMT